VVLAWAVVVGVTAVSVFLAFAEVEVAVVFPADGVVAVELALLAASVF
jgi:hypothetical protein